MAAIGGIFFLLRWRKARKQTSEVDEKTEAGNKSVFDDKDAYVSKGAYVSTKDLPPAPLPAELGNQRNSRAELGDSIGGLAVELDSKGGSSDATELPAYKI